MPTRRPTLSQTFGLVLREHRRKAGLTQETFAFRAKVHPTYVGLVERGLRRPTLEFAQRLAQGLGVTLSVLLAEAEAQVGVARDVRPVADKSSARPPRRSKLRRERDG